MAGVAGPPHRIGAPNRGRGGRLGWWTGQRDRGTAGMDTLLPGATDTCVRCGGQTFCGALTEMIAEDAAASTTTRHPRGLCLNGKRLHSLVSLRATFGRAPALRCCYQATDRGTGRWCAPSAFSASTKSLMASRSSNGTLQRIIYGSRSPRPGARGKKPLEPRGPSGSCANSRGGTRTRDPGIMSAVL
jgi:hypothetical protein